MVGRIKPRYDLPFSRLKRNKIGATNVITNSTGKNSRNNVFLKKQTTKKVLPNIFKDFEVRRKVRIMFKNNVKSKYYIFNGYKLGNKMCLEYLEFKLKQDSCS